MNKRTARRLAAATALAAPGAAGVQVTAQPAPTILTPAPNSTVSGNSVTIFARYTAPRPVASAKVFLGDALIAKRTFEPASLNGVVNLTWDSTSVLPGPHRLTVLMYDRAGVVVARESIPVSIANAGPGALDTIPPQIAIVSPDPNKKIQGSFDIKVLATDNSGKDPYVSVFIDQQLRGVSNRQPYSFPIDSAEYDNGEHMIEAWAYDAARNKATANAVRLAFNNVGGATELNEDLNRLDAAPPENGGPPETVEPPLPTVAAPDTPAPIAPPAAPMLAQAPAPAEPAEPAVAQPAPEPAPVIAEPVAVAPVAVEPVISEPTAAPDTMAAEPVAIDPDPVRPAEADSPRRMAALPTEARPAPAAVSAPPVVRIPPVREVVTARPPAPEPVVEPVVEAPAPIAIQELPVEPAPVSGIQELPVSPEPVEPAPVIAPVEVVEVPVAAAPVEPKAPAVAPQAPTAPARTLVAALPDPPARPARVAPVTAPEAPETVAEAAPIVLTMRGERVIEAPPAPVTVTPPAETPKPAPAAKPSVGNPVPAAARMAALPSPTAPAVRAARPAPRPAPASKTVDLRPELIPEIPADRVRNGRILHAVRPGETPRYLARRYGVPVGRLLAENRLGRNQDLRIGRDVVIPAPFRVAFNNETVAFDVAPRVVNGVSLAALRQIYERAGGRLTWDPTRREVRAMGAGANIIVRIGSGEALVNGRRVNLATPAFIDQGRTFLPVAFISEALGLQADYDLRSGEINLRSNTHLAAAEPRRRPA